MKHCVQVCAEAEVPGILEKVCLSLQSLNKCHRIFKFQNSGIFLFRLLVYACVDLSVLQ